MDDREEIKKLIDQEAFLSAIHTVPHYAQDNLEGMFTFAKHLHYRLLQAKKQIQMLSKLIELTPEQEISLLDMECAYNFVYEDIKENL